MQRRLPEGIVIACDFCGDDWDQVKPMIEGHEGSVLCLTCLNRALKEAAPRSNAGEQFKCTLCLRDLPVSKAHWKNADAPETANQTAMLCADCIKQAATAFDKDPDVDWKKP